MAKEVRFTVDQPPSGDLAVRLWNFLIKAVEKQENVTAVGTLRKNNQKETHHNGIHDLT